jgi:puromycin-sensitive aminopeptidase
VPEDRFRLPRTVVPSRYELTLEPDLDAATFAGTEAVAVEVVEPVTELLLNAQDLEIDEAWLEPADGSGTRLDATVALEPDDERARLTLSGTAEPGAWVLHARFRGELNDKLVGFYRSTFTDDDGHDHTIAVTQFEATHARKAFPCWDEPEAKAVFAVRLVVPEGLTAISNASEVSSEPNGDGRRRITFADTMKMSSYLVAFIVGPLELTQPVDVRGAPLRVAHPPGNAHLTAFALESAAFSLAYFADYYGIPYPGDKCDLVAVPDFAFGAMENLGCITFREVLLLVDPERSTQPELQNVADVIHHELAHMWFGDLVTMKWWNGIWLNEAFATFMEMKCTEAFRPEWQRWVDFGLSRSAAFDIDSLESTRPIEFEVVSPHEAEGMFDVLPYEKGASVLRMREQFLGEDAFRDGIRAYLAEHAYANTETTDLWDAIEASTGEPVRHIMDTWIFQGGYPVVSAEVAGTTLRMGQERLRYDAGDGVTGGDEQWAVPVLIRYGAGDRVYEDRVLLDNREEDFDLRFEPEWLVLNAGGSGFYRVRYTAAQLAALGHRLDQLSALERYGLLDDTFASLLAGTTTVVEVLDLARSFTEDSDVSVWQRLASVLGALDRIVDDEHRARYETTVRALVTPALHRMGWVPAPDEDDRTRQLRAMLFELAGTIGHDVDVRARARTLHETYIDDPEAVDPDMAAAAITVIADSGTREEFDSFLQRFRKVDNPQEQIRYLYSLAKFHDDEAFEEMLDLSLSEVRSQNAPFLLRIALSNRTHGPKAWTFVRRHWDEINERLPSSTIVRMAEGVRTLTDPALANEVQGFFAEHPVPQGERTMAQHLERLRVNVALRAREAKRLADSLA